MEQNVAEVCMAYPLKLVETAYEGAPTKYRSHTPRREWTPVALA